METNKGPFSFLTNFNFPNPFDKRPDTPPPCETVKESQPPKPTVVRFPNPPSVVPPPIEAEAEVTSGKTHNPVVIWQVCLFSQLFTFFQLLIENWKIEASFVSVSGVSANCGG
ncbi:hypothetical protein LINPERPRIM_LOCUS9847 [Linum perenne]